MDDDDVTRQAARQIEMFLEDGDRNRLIVALAILDPTGSNHMDGRCRARHDGSGRCIQSAGHSGACKFRRE